ncbi:B12-binding domain-containing radical SAM protein [Abyssisolibacter fermentans]|uniref:B12-binding domain-containing radical SAM protein n=1 Tax=Abyssisolibacter fermentans TaxID=1766203 RepID=UPI00082D3643|nr:radical SAM protein [Abyssisolibacter fermentans]
MKILLLHPAYKNYKITEPLGICYIGAYLKKNGFDVDLFDPRIYKLDLDSTIHYLKNRIQKYDILGITSCDYYHDDIELTVNKIREIGYKKHITVGGYGPTTNPNRFLQLNVDSIIIGEGEETFFELSKIIQENGCWRNINGIGYKSSDGECKYNERRPLIDNLDRLPFPDRGIYKQFVDQYKSTYISPQIQGSRGCYMACTFCSTPDYLKMQQGRNYRVRSVKNIVDEIEFLYKKYNTTDFEFVDDNFLPLNKDLALQKARKLRDMLSHRKLLITFFMQCRPEYINSQIVSTLREAGLRRIFVGIESVNQEDLKIYGRNYTIDVINNCFRILKKEGFSTDFNSKYRFRYGYINFNPLSTIKGLRKSGEFFHDNNLSYKKLVKKLELFDNKRKVYKIIKDEFKDFSNENYFKDKKVACFYRTLSDYFKIYVNERDKYRVIEKILNKNDIGDQREKGIISSIRKHLDDSAYLFYQEGLDICQYNNYKKELRSFLSLRVEKLNNIIYKNRPVLEKSFKELGVNDDSNDMFF